MQMFQRSIRAVQFFAYPLLVAAGVLFAPQLACALTSYWILQDSNGSWTNAANWNNGVPKNPGDVAIITNNAVLTAARTITIDTAVSLKALKFAIPNSTNGLTVTLGLGSLTMDSGGTGNSVVQQMKGSARCKVDATLILSNDLDIVASTASITYFDILRAITGNFNININPEGSSGTPYMGAANTFIGNINIYNGQMMISTTDAVFGSLTNGTRVITFFNNASFRNNGSLSVLGTNRQFVAGSGGGNYIMHGRNLSLSSPNQLAGSDTFTISTDSGGNTNNVLSFNEANNAFTGTLLLSGNVALKFGTGGSVSNCPLVNLSAATALFDVTAKSGGYAIPSNQVVAGIGVVSGLVSVATAAAKIHPGSYSLPGPTNSPGILTLCTGGLSITNGGVYAWDLAQLKDNAYAPGTTTYSQLAVSDSSVNLTGGKLAVSFVSGIATPASTNAFWKTNHVWTVLTAAAAPVGTLAVTNGPYTGWAFTTRVSSNTLELVYGSYTPPPKGTLMTIH